MGRVYSSYKRNWIGRIVKTAIEKRWYETLVLQKTNKRYATFVHRCVALAFIPNPENKPTVNHKNGIKWDNRVENLEWNTVSENVQHCFDVLGRKGYRIGKKIYQYTLDGRYVQSFKSAGLAAEYMGCDRTNIQKAAGQHNYQATACGYIRKYAD